MVLLCGERENKLYMNVQPFTQEDKVKNEQYYFYVLCRNFKIQNNNKLKVFKKSINN